MKIKPKAGRLGTGSYGVTPPAGDLFGKLRASITPRNVDAYGDSLGSRASWKGSEMEQPLAGQFDTASHVKLPALTTDNTGNSIALVPPHNANNTVQPHERGTFFAPGASIQATRVAGGAAPTAEAKTLAGKASTAFNPNPRSRPKTQRAKPRNAVHVRTSNVPSFLQGTGTLRAHALADSSTPRWSTMKRGAVG